MKKSNRFLIFILCLAVSGVFALQDNSASASGPGKGKQTHPAKSIDKKDKASKGSPLVKPVNAAIDKDAKKKDSKSDTLKSDSFSGLKWRSIGPAYASGRIAGHYMIIAHRDLGKLAILHKAVKRISGTPIDPFKSMHFNI